MKCEDKLYRRYLEILREELTPAMGCTEPIAVAYAAAKARELLGEMPESVLVQASGSIIKNVKSVIVPNTGGRRGIPVAAVAGILFGRADSALEVLAEAMEGDIAGLDPFLEKTDIQVQYLEEGHVFDLKVSLRKGQRTASVRITDHHTRITQMEKNGRMLLDQMPKETGDGTQERRDLFSMERIYDFAETVELGDVQELLDRQIACNMAIAREGLAGDYGANIGRVLEKTEERSPRTKAKAMAAAGSDARMNGCELPVVINSGSGNQGITCSVPVVVYARELGLDRERMYRALVLSNLTAIYEKSGIGTLSAYCGAVSAGAAAGGGIAYLCGGGFDEVKHTVVNALAIVSGIICDGAKASCAAKIAAAVDAGILGWQMYQNGQQFYSGDGIVSRGVDATISNVGTLGRDGMYETNEKIIEMMLKNTR